MQAMKIGFRNVLRNRRRTVLTAMAVGMGLAGYNITDGFIEGMGVNMTRTVTQGMITQGQIHHPDFQDSFRIEDQLQKLDTVREELNSDRNVEAYSERVLGFAMVSSPRNMKNILLYGIDPENESRVSSLQKYLVEGDFLDEKKGLIIGEILKKRLEVELGEKVVITVAEMGTGQIAQELFRVSGVLRSGSKALDERAAFIRKEKAQGLFSIGSGVHEVALHFKDRKQGEDPENAFWEKMSQNGNKAQSWKKIAPGFVSMMDMTNVSKGIVSIILMLLLGFGILNTLFMGLYERMFEFAVLRALGTQPLELVVMVVSEAVALGVLSCFSGFFFTVVFGIPLGVWGVDYGGMEVAEMTFREPVYYQFGWNQVTLYPIVTILFTALISLYPAVHTARISISKAMRRSF